MVQVTEPFICIIKDPFHQYKEVTEPFICIIKDPFHQYKERLFKHRPLTILLRVYMIQAIEQFVNYMNFVLVS